MAPHRPKKRIHLPNGMWVNIFEDSPEVSINSYNGDLHVTNIMNRSGGGTVYIEQQGKVEPDPSRSPVIRPDDYICMPWSAVQELLERASKTP